MSSALSGMLRAIQSGDPSQLALSQLLSQHTKTGHVWIPRNKTSVSGAWYARAADGSQYLAHPEIARAEIYLASWMRKQKNISCDQIPIVSAGLTPAQADAARLLCGHKVACLSGFPGTGKTYTMRAVCDSFRRAGMVVVGCALTGAASARLRDATGLDATTMHRLLGYNPRLGGFQVEEVGANVVIVDECSMPDAGLFLSLCSRLHEKCRLILIGDPEQIPGVQPGDVFRELCKELPHARLTDILRQEADSPIGHAAQSILRGDIATNEDSPTGQGGFYVVPCAGLAISKSGKREANHPLTIAERMSVLDGTPLADIRTMACTNDLVDSINSQFSSHRRVASPVPVMCIKNRHDLGVYNGDMGHRDYMSQVINGRTVILRSSEQRDGWCVTPWKLQGNEALSCQLWCDSSGWGLDRRVTYTALTRAKRRFVFVGDINALRTGIQQEPLQRITLLSALIRGEVDYVEPVETDHKIGLGNYDD